MSERRGIIIHPEELDATWPERLQEAKLTVLGLHPVGGLQAHITLENAIHRHLLNETRALFDTIGRMGIEIEYEAHAMSWLLPREMFSFHPDYFRMDKDGNRTPNLNLCPSSRDCLDFVSRRAEMLARDLETGSDKYFFWMDDAEDCHCHCEKCKNLSPSDQQMLTLNAMLSGIRRYKKSAKLCYLAYVDTIEAPSKIEPMDGIFLEYAPFHRDLKTPLFDASCEKNAQEVRSIQKLLDVFGKKDAQVLEYWIDNSMLSGWKKPPKRMILFEDIMKADVDSYRKLGFESITGFGCYLGSDYRELWGEPPVKRYGEILFEK